MSQTIPESVKTRIQKLLALANDARGNENEAASAGAKVQALLAQYNLEMSQVQETQTDAETPDTDREKAENVAETTQAWQVDLMARIAKNNFCLHYSEREWIGDKPRDTRRHHLIGRSINVMATRQVYDYLMATMERLNPFVDKRTIARRSWFEGCASRLETRLYEERRKSEAESRQATQEAPRGNGSDIVLADVYSTESDLNRDLRWGYVPGTTARERRESEAKWAAESEQREARYATERAAREAQQARETDAQRRRREAKEAHEYEQSRKRWARNDAKEAKRINRDAYAMGNNAGNQIGLNVQIGKEKQGSLF